jgi:WD40 repeat protein
MTASEDGPLHLWQVPSGQALRRVPVSGGKDGIVLDPGGRWVLSRSKALITRFESTTGQELERFELPFEPSIFQASPDGKIVAALKPYEYTIWLSDSGRILPLHASGVTGLVFSRDGHYLAVYGGMLRVSYGYVRVWDIRTGKEMASFDTNVQVTSASFSPDGARILAAGHNELAQIWDLRRRVELFRFFHRGGIYRAMFSHDGRSIFTVSDDGFIHVWNLQDRREAIRIHGRPSQIAESSDGRYAAAVEDKLVEIHALNPDDLVSETCKRVSRNFTPLEWARYFGEEPYRRTCKSFPVGIEAPCEKVSCTEREEPPNYWSQ